MATANTPLVYAESPSDPDLYGSNERFAEYAKCLVNEARFEKRKLRDPSRVIDANEQRPIAQSDRLRVRRSSLTGDLRPS